MAFKRYSDRELQLFLWVILPYATLLNLIVFGQCIYQSIGTFSIAFGATTAYLFLVYVVFGLVAVLIQRRFPANNDLFKRIGVMLPVFYLMNVLMVTAFYAFYNLVPVECAPKTGRFLWAVVFACIASTVITFLNEAVVNWEKWKESVTETEKLKNSYHKTRLLGLKGQINPHFLFNCFNSLSSLINEDEQKAETFLDEMTKVHRYMLRGEDEQLVTLREELKFARSYIYLADVRFCDAIRTSIQVDDSVTDKLLPPLSLQVILENIIYTNTASKSAPLWLSITSTDNSLLISNAVQTRLRQEGSSFEEGLDNLITKYRLLHGGEVVVDERSSERTIILPLLEKREVGV